MKEDHKKLVDLDRMINDKVEKEKDQVKKDIAQKANLTCKICGKYLLESPRCGGHGGGGGGGGSGGGTSVKEAKPSLSQSTKPFGQMAWTRSLDIAISQSDSAAVLSQQADGNVKQDFTLIGSLLAKNVLLIDNDKENGRLTITIDPTAFLYLSASEKKQVCEFIDFVQAQFQVFKHTLTPTQMNLCQCDIKNTVSNDDKPDLARFDRLTQAPALMIQIASPKLYTKFIEHLVNAIQRLATRNNRHTIKLLVTHLRNESQVTDELQQDAIGEHDHAVASPTKPAHENVKSNMTPLKTKPTPKNYE